MPALNTPQFSWCKSNMRRKAQPVPPIFQPEVGAEAVYWAAHQRHREVFVGWPTARAIWGQRFIPGVLDHFAARLAWDGQMYDGAQDPSRPVDLYDPVPGHQGAHGAFDSRAQDHSWEVQLTMQASWLSTLVSGVAGSLVRRLTGYEAPRTPMNGQLHGEAQRGQTVPAYR
jgi:hypothetical protein